MQPHGRAFVDRAVTFTTCRMRRYPASARSARSSTIKGNQHRRRVRDSITTWLFFLMVTVLTNRRRRRCWPR